MYWGMLKECLEEIKNKNKKILLWVRDDDVTIYSESLIKMLNYFEKRNIPLLLAVIPKNCSVSDIKKMIYNPNVTIGQHGYSHENYSDDPMIQSELCSIRDTNIMLKEQLAGKKLLEDEFHDIYTNIFIPPWFEIDEDKYRILKKYYAAFSIWGANDYNDSFVEINSQVDFVNWSNSEIYAGDDFILSQIIRECKTIIQNDNATCAAIGIILHHDYYKPEWYDFLDQLFNELSLYNNVFYANCLEVFDFVNSKEFVKLKFNNSD